MRIEHQAPIEERSKRGRGLQKKNNKELPVCYEHAVSPWSHRIRMTWLVQFFDSYSLKYGFSTQIYIFRIGAAKFRWISNDRWLVWRIYRRQSVNRTIRYSFSCEANRKNYCVFFITNSTTVEHRPRLDGSLGFSISARFYQLFVFYYFTFIVPFLVNLDYYNILLARRTHERVSFTSSWAENEQKNKLWMNAVPISCMCGLFTVPHLWIHYKTTTRHTLSHIITFAFFFFFSIECV